MTTTDYTPETVTLKLSRREGLALRRMLESYEEELQRDEQHEAKLKRKPRFYDVHRSLAEESRTLMSRLHADLTAQDVGL